jgi:hypothetical protein
MKTHAADRHGAPPLSSKNGIKSGPGDMFGLAAGPGAHGIAGLAEPSHAGKTGPARNAGSHVAQQADHGGWKDNSAHVDARGTLGGPKGEDKPKVTK